jgi:hypothetical protein
LDALRRNLERVRAAARERGALPVVARCLLWGLRWGAGRLGLTGRGRFELAGREHELFRSPYHYTWLNERAVEIPLFRELVAAHDPADVLEIGNVLSHYGPVSHRVVDRYERASGVENADVVDVDTLRPYALIASVSTLEHVGLDEEPHDPGKAERAIERLRELLTPDGRLVFSIPVGYNAELERALRAGAIVVDECRALVRRRGRWLEVDPASAWGARYDRLLYESEAVLIVTLSRGERAG